MGWNEAASITSALAGVVAAVGALYANRVARQSLNMGRRAAQAAFEDGVAMRVPVATLLLTQLEYRRCDTWLETGEKRLHPPQTDAEALEVVVRGQLVNNLAQEVLVICRDHPRSGRTSWRGLLNESVFFLDGKEMTPGHAILPAGAGHILVGGSPLARPMGRDPRHPRDRGLGARP
ncbi:hypothetical protein ACFT2C_04755 [Promicromonospora sp. NPDC057138]|uniref:hypothetical protein n=1 Tax=Promicromonospora sp. NPDC057138 TaxID=3346031 RepID=UPI0036276667